MSRRVAVLCASELQGVWQGHTENVSLDGAALYCGCSLTPRTRFTVVFGLPTGETGPLPVVVRWRAGESALVGVQFEGVDPVYSHFVRSAGARIAPGFFVPGPPELDQTASEANGPADRAADPARRTEEPEPEGGRPRLARYEDSLPVRFGENRLSVRRGFTVDLSPRGLSVQARQSPRAGAEIWVDITLPEGRVARVEGCVAWTRPERDSSEDQESFGISVQRGDEAFFQLVLNRQRAVSAGIARLR